MGYYKFTKRELLKELEQVGDDDCIMINMGGHAEPDYPITGIMDSTSIGFWELRCDPEISFWEALKEIKKGEYIMKANAPEKIYLEKVYPDNGVLPNGLNYSQSHDDIEYVRTDAFIEKAKEYLSKHQCEYIDFDDFRKAMKG